MGIKLTKASVILKICSAILVNIRENNCLLVSVQKKPRGCTVYFQFISVINLYVFQAGLLLIIRRYYYVLVYTAISIYTVVPPDDEQ
jgi:hypothetical protein